jgi:ATP-dependent helicase HrpA
MPRPETPPSRCLTADRARIEGLRKRVERAAGEDRAKLAGQLAALRAQSEAAWQRRRESLPRPAFSEELPVNARREEIAEAIRNNPVVIVCGETGSGKTTQLPKILLEQGIGAAGLIGHTQPRRLAARSVAARLAEELQTQVGHGVGVKIRFHDRTGPEAWAKVMTDGILLAETQGDPGLSAYEAIIIDEAHERSLNIDFLLGYLKTLLARRRDLKLIVTSATIDAERFAKHFDLGRGPAPVIEVSGRLYPVEVRYRPVTPIGSDDELRDEEERDLYDAIVAGVDEVWRQGPGDVLVFLPGEREIREAEAALRKHRFRAAVHHNAPEILPLFSRLSASEQDRIFRSHGSSRIVLATNVAETSLTVPGIRYVIDSGLARVKRYSYRNKVEQLQVEPISQAAANQRAGRCGRVAAGVCIRLYGEADYAARPAYTDPEILRASLAAVILRMKALKLAEIEQFPFLDAPPGKAISDGYTQLQELGAIDEDRRLTDTGRHLARLPIDPRVARMIVAANDGGCLAEVLVIAAALSVQDPRERPPDRPQAADQRHRALMFGAEDRSEFLGWLKLWAWYQEELAQQSQRQVAGACKQHFLSFLRMREWRETWQQLHALVTEQGWRENEAPAKDEAIHKALLAGLLGNIGCRQEESGQYLGARGIKFAIHPGSPFAKKAGKWVMAGELVETSKLFARSVAPIDPQWLETVGAHLVKRSHFDPHWEKSAMQAVIWERAVLYGLIVYARRRVALAPLNPAEARELFIREALVAGEVSDHFARQWAFFRQNQALVADIEALEHKQRRQDVLVDETLIAAFYDARIPAGIADVAAFDAWRKEAEREQPKLLHLNRDDLMRHEAAGVTTDAFPTRIRLGGAEYALAYHFEPGSPRDGVTLTLPLAQLNQLPAVRCEWLVPGLLKDKVVQLIKTLPQKIRARVVPVPEFAAGFVAAVAADEAATGRPLIPLLCETILREKGLNARGWHVGPDSFRPEQLPAHLSMNFKLVDEHGRQLDMGRDLGALKAQWGQEAKAEFAAATEVPSAHAGQTDWSFGELPELMELEVAGQTAVGYPALVDDGDSVSLSVFDSSEDAQAAHRQGLLRLFRFQFRDALRQFERGSPDFNALAMSYLDLGSAEELKTQLVELALARACLKEPWPKDDAAFRARAAEARARIGLLLQECQRLTATILAERQTVMRRLTTAAKAFPEAAKDIGQQLAGLFGKRFLVEQPFERLQHYGRYLKAIGLRLDKLRNDAARDARNQTELAGLLNAYERQMTQLRRQGCEPWRVNPQLESFRWQVEELRVQLFAQELRTPVPVSVKRLQRTWEDLMRPGR